MAKIGNHEIVYSETFLVPSGKDIWFTANISGWSVTVNVTFEEGEKQEITVRPVSDHAHIKLVNWNNSLGTALVEPAILGTHQDGRKLYFMVVNYRIGQTNRLDIQLLLGGSE